jgi:hypothetical protein
VSALFRVGHAPVSGQLCGTTNGGAGRRSRFPVAFRLPAFASRIILSPLGDWASLAVGLPGDARTPSGFHVSHARVATGEGALSTPRTAAPTRPIASLRPPPAASQRQRPYTPVEHPSSGAQLDEASSRVHCIHPSGLPLAGVPGWNGHPWASPRSFAPRRYQRRTSGWGQALSTGLGLRSRRHGSTLLPTSPLASCDLVSHFATVATPRHLCHGRSGPVCDAAVPATCPVGSPSRPRVPSAPRN